MIAALILAAAPDVAQASHAVDLLPLIRDVVSVVSLAAGLFFVLAGTLGVLRLPDFFTRLHAAGMTDTLGAELILLGLMIQSGISLMTVKLLLVGFFLLMTSPTATHAVADAAYQAGLKPLLGKYKAPSPSDISQISSEKG